MNKQIAKYENQKKIVGNLAHKPNPSYSVTVAGGLKIEYSKQNGFSLQVLNINELSQKENKEYSLPIFRKGERLDIYC